MSRLRQPGPVDLRTLAPGIVAKTASENVQSSTALQDDNHLFFSTVSGAVYSIRILLRVSGDPAAGIKIGFGEDAVARGYLATASLDTSAAASIVSHPSDLTGLARGTTALEVIIVFQGLHVAAGGTFKLQWAQNSSNATPTIVYPGSFIEYRRVA